MRDFGEYPPGEDSIGALGIGPNNDSLDKLQDIQVTSLDAAAAEYEERIPELIGQEWDELRKNGVTAGALGISAATDRGSVIRAVQEHMQKGGEANQVAVARTITEVVAAIKRALGRMASQHTMLGRNTLRRTGM